MTFKRSSRSVLRAVLLLAALAACAPVCAAEQQESEHGSAAAKPEPTPEEEQALEREEAQKLRRLREEQESKRREGARKLDTEQARQSEITSLRTTVMNLEQRESTLNHDVRTLQQQLSSLPRDPADHSLSARRSELERQLGYTQNQLDYATRSREEAAKRLDALRFRY